MKVLFLLIAFFSIFSQAVNGQIIASENMAWMAEQQTNNPDSDENVPTDSEDEQIECISVGGFPVVWNTETRETVFTPEIRIKLHFFFSLWRPPRVFLD